MLVIDEYLAVDVLVGDWPYGLPDEETLALTACRHFRLLQRAHQPAGGQLSEALARLSSGGRHALRNPHPEVFRVLDPRPLLDQAAQIGAHYSTGGLLLCETLAAGLVHGRQLWFGTDRNVGTRLADVARDLDIAIHVPAVAD